MRLFHICTKKVYEENGEKKIKWYKAGILKETDSGRQYLQLFLMPMVDFYLFEGPPEGLVNKNQTLQA